jgi:hypothetical protein
MRQQQVVTMPSHTKYTALDLTMLMRGANLKTGARRQQVIPMPKPIAGGDRQERSRPPVPRVPVGPHDVNLQLLVDEALDAVLARQDVAAEVEELQNPPDLRRVVEDQLDVIKLNIADHLDRTRQLGNRLHELLAAEISKDTHHAGYFTQLVEVANQLQDALDAMFEIGSEYPATERFEPDHVRSILSIARERYMVADFLISEEKGIRRALKAGRRGDYFTPPEWPEDPLEALHDELFKISEQLGTIKEKIRQELQNQSSAARENLEFRALETEWSSARADLTATTESVIQSLVRAALNRATSAQFASHMNIGSLEGLRETITNEKVIITASFRHLESVIGQRGEGSFGIAGPRGVGKSTLIKFFTTPAAPLRAPGIESHDSAHHQRLGVTVSAPVAYDPRDFMLHLHSEVCRAVLGPDGDWEPDTAWSESPQRRVKRLAGPCVALAGTVSLTAGTILLAHAAPLVTAPHRWWSHVGLALTGLSVIFLMLFLIGMTRASMPHKSWHTPEMSHMEIQFSELTTRFRSASLALLYCLTLAFCTAVGLPLVAASEGLGRGTWLLLGGVAAVAVGLTLLFAGWRMVRFHQESLMLPLSEERVDTISTIGALREVARDQLRQIRYEQTLNSERSMVVKLGGMRQLPLGVDVGAKQGTTVAERAKTYPEIVTGLRSFIESVTKVQELVIAIDELDKLKSAESVENFLNDIKAVFGSSRCFFLVSVSEEAAASFERRGVPFRDVFDSSFDAVVTLKRLTMNEARKVLYSLLFGWTEPFVALCYVLSGGLPRELHRSVREVVGREGEGSEIDLAQAVPELMQREAIGRLWAARHSLQRESFDPVGLTLLSQIEGIQPEGATAVQFRQWYEEFRSWATREGSISLQPGGSARLCTAARLGCELASFMLFAATMIEFFGDTLDATRLKQAETPTTGDKSLTHLAEARHTLSINPWSSAASVARFRKAWGM